MVTLVAFCWLVLLAAAPLMVWHGVIGATLSSFHLNLAYLAGELSPWVLLAAGILFLVPVAVSAGRTPESRLYPRARRAYVVWGTVAYLLGLVLSVQVSTLWHYAH